MSDRALREAERMRGERPARYLKERLRTGTITREKIELMAYCGDPAARLVEGYAKRGFDPRWGCLECQEDGTHAAWCRFAPFTNWLAGLERWPPETLQRAAVAAGRAALPVWEAKHAEDPGEDHPRRHAHRQGRRYKCCSAPRLALEAAQAHLDCLCAEHRDAWFDALSSGQTNYDDPFACGWIVRPTDKPLQLQDCVDTAAREAGEGVVRAAVQAALVKWSLEGE